MLDCCVVMASLAPLPPHTGEGEMAVRDWGKAHGRDQQLKRRLHDGRSIREMAAGLLF